MFYLQLFLSPNWINVSSFTNGCSAAWQLMQSQVAQPTQQFRLIFVPTPPSS